MSINGQLKKLYDQWEKEHPGDLLIRHGLVDEESYLASRHKKVVLLGKEPNSQAYTDLHYEESELMKFTYDETKPGKKILKSDLVAGLWVYGIHNKFPPYNRKNAKEGLKSLGKTNLKKSAGKGISVEAEIRKWATNSLNLWQKELEIMKPDIILFAGTYRCASCLLNLDSKPISTLKNKRYYSIWKMNGHDCLCIDFYHHAVRSRPSPKEAYQLLSAVFAEMAQQGFYSWE